MLWNQYTRKLSNIIWHWELHSPNKWIAYENVTNLWSWKSYLRTRESLDIKCQMWIYPCFQDRVDDFWVNHFGSTHKPGKAHPYLLHSQSTLPLTKHGSQKWRFSKHGTAKNEFRLGFCDRMIAMKYRTRLAWWTLQRTFISTINSLVLVAIILFMATSCRQHFYYWAGNDKEYYA